MLQDSFGRRFYYLRLSVTDICNFRCNYCLPDGFQCDKSTPDFLSLKEISVFAKAFAILGTEKIRLTGGEPALRRELPEIIARCKQIDGIKKVAVTTNGYNLPSVISSWHDAGLDALNVSIDSLNPANFKKITGHDRLHKVLAGIERAQSLGISSIKVNAVLLKNDNATEIDQFIDWLKNQPVTLRFIELMQTGDNEAFFKAQHVSGASIIAKLLKQGWQPIIKTHDAGPAEEFWHPDYQGRIGVIRPYSKDFCKSCNRLRISALGKLHLCLFANEGIDLREYAQQEDAEQLAMAITHLITHKTPSHLLHQGQSGMIQHLSMLGG
ncbi:GTP 3',8-cyclase MoaA [Zooshikella sp. RANM57]|uniref:GTP 3',8-cyclase MoaA n=1 Tax=Zooshikella sp. RANM57 TaxID=3425863 RepID=UPI003D6ECBB5